MIISAYLKVYEIHFHEASFEIIFELSVHFIRVCFFSKTNMKIHIYIYNIEEAVQFVLEPIGSDSGRF